MKISIFSPYATVAPHFETELELAQVHLDKGDQVEYVSCQGGLSNCDFNPDRHATRCDQCVARRIAGLQLLKPNASQSCIIAPKHETKIPDRFDSVEEVQNFSVDGFDVGYAALSSLVSIIRDPEPDFDEYGPLLRRFIDTALESYFFTLDYIQQKRPERIYVFNGRFSPMRSVLRACQKTGVDCWIHERGCDGQHYELFPNHLPHDIEKVDQRIRELWNTARESEREEVGASWFHDRINRVEKNWHSFVKKQDQGFLPDDWDNSRRNISIFNSSDDEFVSIGASWTNPLYPNQVEAIELIAEDLLISDPTVHLYVRVHPNLTKVDNLRKRQLLALDFPNLTIIPPDAKVDSYELLKASEKVVSFGSSIGIEAVYWERPSISLGPCFYQSLEGTYRPNSHEQTLKLLSSELQPLPKTGALQYGYWNQTRGQKYKYFVADGLFEGSFKGQVIHAGMHQTKPKSVSGKIKREALRFLGQLNFLRS